MVSLDSVEMVVGWTNGILEYERVLVLCDRVFGDLVRLLSSRKGDRYVGWIPFH